MASDLDWPERKEIINSSLLEPWPLQYEMNNWKHEWGSESRTIDSRQDRPCLRTTECYPSRQPHLTTALLKSYLGTFLLPRTSCPTVKNKLQVIPKSNNLKRQSKHQLQTWQGCWNYETRNLKQWWIFWSLQRLKWTACQDSWPGWTKRWKSWEQTKKKWQQWKYKNEVCLWWTY